MNINFTLIAQALTFAAFIWFTARFVWPPLMRAVEARQKQIAEGLAAGERGRQELELAGKHGILGERGKGWGFDVEKSMVGRQIRED